MAALPLAVAAAPSASRRVVPAPETVPLPDGFRPEGMTSRPVTTFYAGSMQDGRLGPGPLLDHPAPGPVTEVSRG